jgi:biotin transport system substrate-specific component
MPLRKETRAKPSVLREAWSINVLMENFGEKFMEKSAIQTLSSRQERAFEAPRQLALLVGATLFVALCARITIPLPFTPVPLTVQNFAVLLVGLMLGSRSGFAALALYLVEGAVGMPVFSPTGPGGIAQLLGPTGGFLLAYPLVAWLVGYVMERGRKSFIRAAVAGFLGEIVLFMGGLTWLAILTHSVMQAFRWGLYWFIFAEIIKVMLAAGIAARWSRKEIKN